MALLKLQDIQLQENDKSTCDSVTKAKISPHHEN
jgi:hypothetical protein